MLVINSPSQQLLSHCPGASPAILNTLAAAVTLMGLSVNVLPWLDISNLLKKTEFLVIDPRSCCASELHVNLLGSTQL